MTFAQIFFVLRVNYFIVRLYALRRALWFWVKSRLMFLGWPADVRAEVKEITSWSFWRENELRGGQLALIRVVKRNPQPLGPTALVDMALLKLFPQHREYIINGPPKPNPVTVLFMELDASHRNLQ